MNGEVDDRALAGGLDRFEREQSLADEGDGLGDDIVHAFVDGPAHLLVEHAAHLAGRLRVAVHEDVGVGHIAGDQRVAPLRGFPRQAQRGAVHLLQRVLLADDTELLAMGVVGEGQHDVGACVQEVAVELSHDLRVLQNRLRHVGAGGEITATLDLEQIALGADDGSSRQPFAQIRSARRCGVSHGGSSPYCYPPAGPGCSGESFTRHKKRRTISP